ncbi:MAG: hypothetical protein R3D57_19035 [Hyphomicrobiaceae bacterium]
MKKIILTATVALVSTLAVSSAFAGGCGGYSYDSYSGGYSTTYTPPVYSSGYNSYGYLRARPSAK